MPAHGQEGLTVLLLGNYPNDRQESMHRFMELLAQNLPHWGIDPIRLCPAPVFGRLHRSPFGVGKWLGYLDKFLLFPVRLQRWLRSRGSNVLVHICDHSNAVYANQVRGVPHLVTCHDLLAVRSALGEFAGQAVRPAGKLYQRWILRGLNASASVACVSQATRRDLLRLSTLQPDQTAVVHNGLNYAFGPVPGDALPARLQELSQRYRDRLAGRKLEPGFLLHVGGNHWYKNRAGVIQIFARLSEKLTHPPFLVMVGQPLTGDMRQSLRVGNLADRVIELAGVSNQELQALYSAAQLLLFPSLEEGFGWPIIEAQACGCPVVTTQREPMTEIGGDGAVYIRIKSGRTHEDGPMSRRTVENAADTVIGLLSESPSDRARRVQAGLRNAERFATARMLEGYVQLYHRLTSGS